MKECPECDGAGMVPHEYYVPDCCGHGLPNGECCGNPVPAYQMDYEPCSMCQGEGKIQGKEPA